MENFTVKEIGAVEQKSSQEIEQTLLDRHEESLQHNDEPVVQEVVVDEAPKEYGDSDVLSYIKNRYNKDVTSIDELLQKREDAEELPGDVSAYFKYKKETGRGIEDFVKLNRNFDDMSPEQLLAEYYSNTEEDLDQDDISYMIEDRFSYDEDFDDPKDIKKKEIAKKKELAKAKKFFEDSKEAYKVPIESKGNPASNESDEDYNAYKKYVQESQTQQQDNSKKSEYFQKKTDELFSSEFKGFDFDLGDKKVTFLPGDPTELKNAQSDLTNFISKHLDENGLISDAKSYHRSLAAAMNPDKIAKFFYEQGKTDALLDSTKKIKNIDMSTRSVPQSISQSGFKVTSLDNDSGRGLKIKSSNKH